MVAGAVRDSPRGTSEIARSGLAASLERQPFRVRMQRFPTDE